jgi:hypothetical protein
MALKYPVEIDIESIEGDETSQRRFSRRVTKGFCSTHLQTTLWEDQKVSATLFRRYQNAVTVARTAVYTGEKLI